MLIQGDQKRRGKSRGQLHCKIMPLVCCLRAQIDHKYGTFCYLNQGSQIFPFKIHFRHLYLNGNLAKICHLRTIFADWLHKNTQSGLI